MLKRGLAPGITTPDIDSLYDRARSAGSIGGKMLGAGGGGFLLLFVAPELREQVAKAVLPNKVVDFKFSSKGSKIIYLLII